MANITVVLDSFKDDHGTHDRHRFCTVEIDGDQRAVITYTNGEHAGSYRHTSKVEKIYRKPVYDLAHNHLWDEVVVRTANSEYVFRQGSCRFDSDYETWDEYDSILRGELLAAMDRDPESVARDVYREMRSNPHDSWVDCARRVGVTNDAMLKILSWAFVD